MGESDQTEADARKQLKAEYERLQSQLETMYMDRLDGRITAKFYDEKSAEWRRQQKEIETRMTTAPR